MKRTPETLAVRLASLEARILAVARGMLPPDEKIKAIFNDPDFLPENVSVDFLDDAWRALKMKRQFWQEVTLEMKYIDYEGKDLNGKDTFSVAAITHILGRKKAVEIEGPTLSDTTKGLLRLTEKATAKDYFTSYMFSYDEDAVMYCLVLYGRYLFLTRGYLGLKPFVAASMEPGRASELAFGFQEELELECISGLELLKDNRIHRYYFKMLEKKTTTKLPEHHHQFQIIKLNQGGGGVEETVTIATEGIITQVLKFFHDTLIHLVLTGPTSERLLVRVNYANVRDHFVSTVFPAFPFPFQVQDVTFLDGDTPHSFSSCTYMKCVNTDLGELRRLRVSSLPEFEQPKLVFKTIRPKKGSRALDLLKIRDVNGVLTEEELQELQPLMRVLLLVQLGRTEASLTEDEKLQLAQQVLKQTGQPTESEVPLFVKLAPMDLLAFVQEGDGPFNDRDNVFLAAKIVELPGEDAKLIYVAVLCRTYTSVTDFNHQLIIIDYTQSAEVGFVPTRNFMRFPLGTAYSSQSTSMFVRTTDDFNLVFCAPGIFYVEIVQRVKPRILEAATADFFVYCSRFLLLDRARRQEEDEEYKERSVLEKEVPHYGFYEMIKNLGYKLWRNGPPRLTSRYETVLYRYDQKKKRGRMLFYKHGLLPTIASLYLDDVALDQVVSITPISGEEGEGIAYLTIKMRTLEPADNEVGFVFLESYRILRVMLGTSFVDYGPEYDLSKALGANLTFKLRCVYCRAETELVDQYSRKPYCEPLCQLLYGTTALLY